LVYNTKSVEPPLYMFAGVCVGVFMITGLAFTASS
jgi:hypothetical protein